MNNINRDPCPKFKIKRPYSQIDRSPVDQLKLKNRQYHSKEKDNQEIEELVQKLRSKLQKMYPEDTTAQMDSKMEFHLGPMYKGYKLRKKEKDYGERGSSGYYGTELQAVDTLRAKPKYAGDLFSRIKTKQFHQGSKNFFLFIILQFFYQI